MKLPGEALLRFEVQPHPGDARRTRLVQTARFKPAGPRGLAYWYAVLPLHSIVFSGMLEGIRREAELSDLHVVGAAIVEGGRCLVAQRSAAMALPLKWEFPGGKVHTGETPEAALAREIREELGLEVEVGERLGVTFEEQVGRRLRLEVHLCTLRGGELALAEHREARWVAAAELDALDWASADRPLLGRLRAALDRPATG